METYKAAYRWTQEELLRSMRHHYQTKLRPSVLMAVNVVSVLLAVLAVFILVTGGLEPAATMSCFIFIGFAIYWLFLRQKITNWWVGRGFSERPDANELIEWEISEEKIKSQLGGLASSETQWKFIIKVIETNDGFLFYIQQNLFYWMPFSAFERPRGIEKVREYVKANGVQYDVRATDS